MMQYGGRKALDLAEPLGGTRHHRCVLDDSVGSGVPKWRFGERV